MTRDEVDVIVDVARGSFVKRDDEGQVDFISPIPCPFNYGHVPGTQADDGDAVDAVVLGSRLCVGTVARVPVQGRIAFLDAGRADPKWICAPAPLSASQRLQVGGFFRSYAAATRLLNRIRGRRGPTRYLGWL